MAKGSCKRARKATPTADNCVDGHNGAVEASCSVCEVIIDDGKELQCRACHSYFHHVCANISDNVFEILHPILPSVNWICQECIDISIRRKTISTEIQPLTDVVRKLGATGAVGITSTGLSSNSPNTRSISQVVSHAVKDQL